ncbi:hypothetical protein BP5796_11524 [Coleophoma crateriformis]|uniref:FAD-binding FR-type domain-containing protein n=1 Tax=Coleophoma crateriformis TaxID=565419 RepID=A0A3D8QIH0_9HELO|nr:hypothetical protein BP5796_11524 [Coleophoma crateriformis]
MTDQVHGQQHQRSALVVYGSETGNSEDAAHDLDRMLERLHFVTRVCEMDRIEILGANEIYPRGEGDEQHEEGIDGTFLNWSADLRKHLLSAFPLPDGLEPIPEDAFLPPKYCVSVDASSSSSTTTERRPGQQSRFASKPSQDQLATLKSSTSRDHTNPDPSGEELPDMSTLVLKKLWQEPVNHESNAEDGSQLKEPVAGDQAKDIQLPSDDCLPIPHGYEAYLVTNFRLTPPDHWQDVRHLSFIIPADIEYFPGDTMTLFPKNFPEDVQALIDLMDWNTMADIPLRFHSNLPDYQSPQLISGFELPHLFPLEKTTLRELLTHNLDITAIPKRSFFQLISHHTSDQMHKDRLLEFANPTFTDEFYDYTSRPRRSILEVLQDFPSVKLPMKYVISFFPVIRGREYSIASGGHFKESRDPRYEGMVQVHLLVALVKYRTVLKKVRQGLCSRYIASLPEGARLAVTFNTNEKFFQPAFNNPQFPLILIGPGTGIAPLHAMVWERKWLSQSSRYRSLDFGRIVVFYGGRNRNADFLYERAWEHPATNTTVYSCFSRDQPEKHYVQDLIREKGEEVCQLLDQGAIVYICGSSGKMPKAVRQALVSVLEEHKSLERKDAEERLEAMEKGGKFVQETW